jgi:hypothetical protein
MMIRIGKAADLRKRCIGVARVAAGWQALPVVRAGDGQLGSPASPDRSPGSIRPP